MHFQRALEISQQIYPPRDFNLLKMTNNLGQALTSIGQFQKAEQALLQALALARATIGSAHPQTGMILKNLANLLAESGGDLRRAEPHR